MTKPLLFTLALCLLFLPFINKAFHVDEPFYLKMAEQIRRDPLRPYSFSINWSGETRDVWERIEATFPPLVPGYLALLISLFGEKEWALHIFFIPFALLALLAFWHLANRWTEHPYLATALFFGAPAFFVMATTLMLDVPLLALSLLGVLFLVEGLEEKRPRWLLWVSGIFFALSALTKYTGLLNLIVAALYGFILKKPPRKWLIPILVAAGIFLIWCLHNWIVYGGIHVLRATGHVGKEMSLHKALALLCFIGGGFWFPIFFFYSGSDRFPQWIKALVVLLAISVSGIIFIAKRTTELSTFFWGLYFSLLTVLLFMGILAASPWKSLTGKFLLSWFFLALLSLCIWEPWVSARYLLPMLAPAVLLFVQSFRVGKFAAFLLGLFGLGIGLPLSKADQTWAGHYRIFAEQDIQKFKIGKVDGFLGHWGFQYYLEKIGAKPYEISQKILPEGYLLAYASLPDPRPFPSEVYLLDGRRGIWQEVKRINAYGRLRLASPSGVPPAGFYSSLWGILPYSTWNGPMEVFCVAMLVPEPSQKKRKR